MKSKDILMTTKDKKEILDVIVPIIMKKFEREQYFKWRRELKIHVTS